jgi:hypothetical protein
MAETPRDAAEWPSGSTDADILPTGPGSGAGAPPGARGGCQEAARMGGCDADGGRADSSWIESTRSRADRSQFP